MRLHLVCFAVALSITVLATQSAIADDSQPVDIAKFKDAVAKCERAVTNLRVKAETKKLIWNPVSKGWDDGGLFECTAWYDGDQMGKEKVDVQRELRLWQKTGKRAFTEDHYLVAFDGERGTELDTATGIPGELRVICNATITKDRPIPLSTPVTGWDFSLYGGRKWVGSFSTCVDEHTGPPGSPQRKPTTVTNVKVEGLPCVEVTTYFVGGSGQRIDLDPARSYALVRHDRFNQSGVLVERTLVKSFIEAAPGVFYPKEAVLDRNSNIDGKAGDPFHRLEFKATEAVANDPAFTDENFKIQLPANAVIKDLSHPGL